jgi:hypothetical protein
MYVCMYVCSRITFREWYSFISLFYLIVQVLYKYKDEYKQGEMWHSAQRAEISEEIYML